MSAKEVIKVVSLGKTGRKKWWYTQSLEKQNSFNSDLLRLINL